MPTVGGLYIPDNLVPTLAGAAAPVGRPGVGAVLAAAARGAVGNVRYGLPYMAEKLLGTASAQDEAAYQQGLAATAASAATAAPASVSDLTSGKVGFGSFIGENLAASLPYMVGGVVGGLAGGALGGGRGAIAGAIAGGIPQFAGSNVARAVDEQGGLSVASAAKSLAVAPFQSAADAAIARFLPGAGHVLGEAAATQSGGFLRRTAMSMAEAGGTEAVTEAAQQLGERYAAGKKLGDADAAGEYVNAAVTAMALGGVLGAGGGFRRSPAVAYNPADVLANPDLMDQHVQGVLDGTLALPSPQSFGRDPSGPIEGTGPAIEMPNPTNMIVDSEGNAGPPGVATEQAMAQARNLPQPSGPTDADLLAGLPQPQAPIQLGQLPAFDPAAPILPTPEATSAAALTGTPVGQTPVVVPPPAPRPFQDVDVADLNKARKAKNADPAIVTQIEAELSARKAEDPFSGVPMNQDIAKLRGSSLDDQVAGVRKLLEDGDSRTGTMRLAERLGIDVNAPGEAAPVLSLDETPPPAPIAAVTPEAAGVDVSALDLPQDWAAVPPPAPIAAVTPEAAPVVAPTPAIAVTPPAGQLPTVVGDPEAQAMQMLGTETAMGQGNKLSSKAEAEAKRLGLITDDDAMDITPKGRRAYLRTPDAPAAIAAAADRQGLTGAQQSQFERGVQASLSGDVTPEFTSVADQVAFETGQVWADDFVQNGDTISAAQTGQVTSELGGNASAQGERRSLTDQQVNQRVSARLIDAAALDGVSEGDMATLVRASRTGAPLQVAEMIQHVQKGGTLFTQPETGEVQLTTQVDGRGQPVFKEMNTPERGASRADNRAQTDEAMKSKRTALFTEINEAYNSSDITPKQRVKMMLRLSNNDFKGVIDRLPGGPLENQMNITRLSDLGKIASAAVEQMPKAPIPGERFGTKPITQTHALALSGNITSLLQSLAKTSSDPQYRQLAQRLLNGGGWGGVDLAVGDARGNVYGSTRLNEDGTSSVRLFGENGVTEETILHELTHAYVQQRWGAVGAYTPENRALVGDPAARGGEAAVEKFQELWRDIGGALHAYNPELVSEEAWASNFYDSPDEALSWVMTNKQAQAWFKQFDEQGNLVEDKAKSLWDKVVDWVRGVVGLPDRPASRSMLDTILDAGNAIVDAGKDVRTRDFGAAFAKAWSDENPGQLIDMERNVETRTADGANSAAKQVSEALSAVVDKINPLDLKTKGRRLGLGLISHTQMDRAYGFTEAHSLAQRTRTAIDSRFKQMFEGTYQRYEALMKAQPKVAESISRVMSTSTELGFDPDKSWDEHTWIEDAEKARLKPAYDQMMKLVNDMKRGDQAGWASFKEFRALNEAQNFARMAVALHAHVASDPELALGVNNATVNPADAFMETAQGVSSPEEIRAYWDRELTQQTQAASQFVRDKKGVAATGTTNDQLAARNHLMAIEERINSTLEARKAMSKAPYFHLGRFGDNFASAMIRTFAGQMNPADQRKVAEAFEKAGFSNIQISADNTKPKIAARFETVDAAERFKQVALDLERQGLLDRGSVKAGPRNTTNDFGTAQELPAFVRNYIDNLDTHPRFAEDSSMSDKEKASLRALLEQMKQTAIDTYVESQPDNSISKVLTKRYTVSGYNPDMIRSFAHRWRVGSTNIANVATAPKFNKFYGDMKAQYNEALSANSPLDPYMLQDVTNELKARDAQSPVNELADVFDKVRGFTHSYFLGFSPAYGLINMTQLGVTALPEMAKKHGYAKSFHAMRRATPQVMSIIKAVGSEALKLGWKNAGDIAITEDVLRKAGLDDNTRQFVQNMMATGTIDIGSMARSLAQVADDKGIGGKTETYLRLSSAMGLYTETASRLITALSARELHGDFSQDAQAYAAKTVSESMFDYQSWNTARQLGKKGFLGPVTPIVTQFMSYQAQLTEKLYSEARDAFSRAKPGESAEAAAERRKGSQRFLAGHLTAVTALAGTLGMPFAAAFAFAIEKMVDTFGDDDEPFDATASWRGFLSDVLGKDVGEVLARGAPRAAGFDISSRAGEQSLLPGSDLLFDKRSWKDAVANSAGRSMGAAPSMLINILDGGNMMADGDVLGGMKSILPVAFKGPTEAYRMSEDGYIDTKGNKLPITPTSSAILWQLLGFSPAAKAEYGEARGDQAARRGELQRRSGMLRNGISRAMLQGDSDKAQELIRSAMQFDQDNPAFAVLPSVMSSLQRRQQNAAASAATGSPTGVSMNDIAGQRLTSYANF